MPQKKHTSVKQGAVSDVMSHLSALPEREKDPEVAVGLSQVFRTKEYAMEIDRALKRGYSFADLAEIFTERCGVKISARQLKYHHTHERNLRAKGKKSKSIDTSKKGVSAENPLSDRISDAVASDSNVAGTTTEAPPRNLPSTPKGETFSQDWQRQQVESD